MHNLEGEVVIQGNVYTFHVYLQQSKANVVGGLPGRFWYHTLSRPLGDARTSRPVGGGGSHDH